MFEDLSKFKIKERSSNFLYSREEEWKAKHAETHVTLITAANILGCAKQLAAKKLGDPDIVCPWGCKTRMWSRDRVNAVKELGVKKNG